MSRKIIRTCTYCGVQYCRKGAKLYCSWDCYVAFKRGNPKQYVSYPTRTCRVCKEEKSTIEFQYTGRKHADSSSCRMHTCRICWRELHRKAVNKTNRIWNRNLRIKVIEGLGGTCSCCGEVEVRWLSIDHIGGWGKEHRKIISGNSRGGRQKDILLDIIKQGYPRDKFQILCWNCHMSMHHYGECPHKEIIKIAVSAASY